MPKSRTFYRPATGAKIVSAARRRETIWGVEKHLSNRNNLQCIRQCCPCNFAAYRSQWQSCCPPGTRKEHSSIYPLIWTRNNALIILPPLSYGTAQRWEVAEWGWSKATRIVLKQRTHPRINARLAENSELQGRPIQNLSYSISQQLDEQKICACDQM